MDGPIKRVAQYEVPLPYSADLEQQALINKDRVIAAVKDRGVTGKPLATLAVTIMLGIAYAADMGGMATLVGTPPNLSYKEQLVRLFPDAPPPSFAVFNNWRSIWSNREPAS